MNATDRVPATGGGGGLLVKGLCMRHMVTLMQISGRANTLILIVNLVFLGSRCFFQIADIEVDLLLHSRSVACVQNYS